MNNKPVAWIDPKELNMDASTSVTKNKQFDGDIPLYTHQAKTLTDEEITDLFRASSDHIEFARAILKKAKE